VIRNRFKGILILNQISYVHQILIKKEIKNYLLNNVLIKAKLYVKLIKAKNIKNADIKIY